MTKTTLIDAADVKKRLAGHPEDVNSYLRGLLADGITLTMLAGALGITPQCMATKARRVGVDAKTIDIQRPHKRCPSCGRRYWNKDNKTCGRTRCRVLNKIDMEKLCDAIETVVNYSPWRKVSREIFGETKDVRTHAIKCRVCRWVEQLGYSKEAKMLASIDNRPQSADLRIAEREALRELARILRDTKAAS